MDHVLAGSGAEVRRFAERGRLASRFARRDRFLAERSPNDRRMKITHHDPAFRFHRRVAIRKDEIAEEARVLARVIEVPPFARARVEMPHAALEIVFERAGKPVDGGTSITRASTR